MTEYKRKVVGKTSVSISGRDVPVLIVRNERGNLEIWPQDETTSWHSEWYNQELCLYDYKG